MASPLLMHKRRDKLAAQYIWKAENIVRFFDHLGMTTEQKVKFLADELAGAYMLGNLWRLDEPLSDEGVGG